MKIKLDKKASRAIFISVCAVLLTLTLFLTARVIRLAVNRAGEPAPTREAVTATAPAPATTQTQTTQPTTEETTKAAYIKWVSFDVSESALEDTLWLDIETHTAENHISWIDSLSYLACKNGGNFKKYKKRQLNEMYEMLSDGTTVDSLMADNKYYTFYQKAYGAVLGGMVGEYKKEAPDPADKTKKILVEKYGLKAYNPIAEGFHFSHSDDFGNARNFGYKRTHLGNDLVGSVGTPIVAVEGGTVEAFGWNRFGGWRLGIRSFDGKRSYYYAHLRRNHPYAKGIELGCVVKAGQVIGYLGMTGYSNKENYNGMNVPHLHIGMQLIFDESQKEGINQIWIDMYALMEFLKRNKASVERNEEEKEYYRVYDIYDPAYPKELRQIPPAYGKAAAEP